LQRIESKLDELLSLLRNPAEVRTSYTVEEAAELLGVSRNTVRIWCRHGRINAARRSEKSGGVELWGIPASEITRYRNHGLLPMDPGRNARS
jgi:excisionase family DNA binding protein